MCRYKWIICRAAVKTLHLLGTNDHTRGLRLGLWKSEARIQVAMMLRPDGSTRFLVSNPSLRLNFFLGLGYVKEDPAVTSNTDHIIDQDAVPLTVTQDLRKLEMTSMHRPYPVAD